ncbi:hypothetical protein H0R92_08290 [Treponema sp. OMZ 840]|uniref:HD-GYP domain-containing protein n=1 Tax=Treponema sp. OMZ 840 TaxID=244313 RepID=UPI003D8D6043
METIKSESLKEGMRFSAPVFFDDGKNMFLGEKRPVTPFHLNVLTRWKIPYVITYGKECSQDQSAESDDVEELEMLEELEPADSGNSSLSNIIRKKMTDVSLWQSYSKALKSMQRIYMNYKDEDKVDKSLFDEIVKSVYKLVNEDRDFALNCVFCKIEKSSFYPGAALDTAILVTVVGSALSLPQPTIIHSITAALLHHLDMMHISDPALGKSGQFGLIEDVQLKTQLQKTTVFASDVLMYPREVIVILMQRHEHWDGTGFPDGRRGEDIDIGARLLIVCDAFYNMISKKPEGGGLLAYDAAKKLLDAKEKYFDSSVLKAFVRSIGLYPPGTFVLLNDSSIAQVVCNNAEAPFVPSVQIILSNGAKEDKVGQLIDLNVQKTVFIVRAIHPESEMAGG